MSLLKDRVGSIIPSKNAIFINQDKDLGYVIDSLMLHQIRHLLCVNDELELKGIVSIMDVLSALYKTGSVDFLNTSVEEIMTKQVYTVNADESIRDTILLLENMGLSGLPVMSDESIAGFFTTKDVIGVNMNATWDKIPDKKISLDDNNIGRLLSEDDIITDYYTIWQIADKFIQSKRRQLVVNSGETGNFLGLLTPAKLFTTLIPSFGKKFESGLLHNEPFSNFDVMLNTFTSTSTSIQSVRKEMRDHGIGGIPLISNQKVMKIITEKDLLGYLSINI